MTQFAMIQGMFQTHVMHNDNLRCIPMANCVLLFQACNLCFQSLSFLVTLSFCWQVRWKFLGSPHSELSYYVLGFLVFIDFHTSSLNFHRFYIGFMVFMVQELYVCACFMCLMLEQIYYFYRFTTDSTILLLLKNIIMLREINQL